MERRHLSTSGTSSLSLTPPDTSTSPHALKKPYEGVQRLRHSLRSSKQTCPQIAYFFNRELKSGQAFKTQRIASRWEGWWWQSRGHLLREQCQLLAEGLNVRDMCRCKGRQYSAQLCSWLYCLVYLYRGGRSHTTVRMKTTLDQHFLRKPPRKVHARLGTGRPLSEDTTGPASPPTL